MEEIKKDTAPEVSAQEQQRSNFSPITGEKLHDTCPRCWVKKDITYNCGFSKCPGYRLIVIEARAALKK